jgi:hypothetical protein
MMRRAIFIPVLLALAAGPLLAQTQRVRPRRIVPAQPIQDMVEGFYVSQLRSQMELSDDQFAKLLPLVEQTLRERREISGRRTQAMNELRLLIEQGGSEEDMKRLIGEIDKTDAEIQASQQKFLDSADPLLTIRQQARLRVVQAMIETRIRLMIERARFAGPNRLPPQ